MSRKSDVKIFVSDKSSDTSADENEELTLKQLDDELSTKDIENKLKNQSLNDLENELSQFRFQWKQELLQQQQKQQQNNDKPTISKTLQYGSNNQALNKNDDFKYEDDNYDLNLQVQNEKKSAYLFNKGVLLEQQGRLYEAIKFYRMAMQLDPDIEFKLASSRKHQQKNKNDELNDENFNNNNNNNKIEKFNENDDENLSLYERFQNLITNNNTICEKQYQQKSAHFSNLPFEVVIYILRWVVSEDLDVRSLEMFSNVCKGFYVCARDPEIWKTACEKIWKNNLSNQSSNYGSWREMYLNRLRLNFDGCYISKASYIRAGEQSLDSFYRPWHLVEYFRFLRFFPDGTVLMLTTPEEPKLSVGKLKLKNIRDVAILKGNWTLNSNRVTVILVKKVLKHEHKKGRRGNAAKEIVVNQDMFYNMEFEICTVGKRSNMQLIWMSYDLLITNKLTNNESTTSFEINKIDFPPFYFSRVKSYTSTSEVPLI